jgi:sterol desaturase/sphingolipid hydroxylase (fatty acid hydroxylase superfamily)
MLAMIFFPLFLHDCWFYWSHRIEHKVPILWEFHKIHQSDERMNTSTWARNHFLQESWRAFSLYSRWALLSISTQIIDLHPTEAGKTALYSTMFLIGPSMFYHSAIRVRLPWLDRILVTPQVYRINHSVNAERRNRNCANVLPIFGIVSGTYHRPYRRRASHRGARPGITGTSLVLVSAVWAHSRVRSRVATNQSPRVRPFEVRMGGIFPVSWFLVAKNTLEHL